MRSLHRFVYSGSLPPLEHIPAREHLWSKLSSCRKNNNDDAWNCLFGKTTQSCSSLSNVSAAEEIIERWSDEDVVTTAGAIAQFLAPDVYHLDSSIVSIQNVLSPTEHKISVHARFGDSCDYMLDAPRDFKVGDSIWGPRGRPCFNPKVYFAALERVSALYNTKNVLVATDSQAFLDEILKMTDFNFVYVNYTGRGNYEHGKGWIETRHDLTQDMADASLSDLYVLQQGHILVGGFFGHLSNAAYMLMVGRAGTVLPYISIDGGGLLKSEAVPAADDLFNFAIRR
jgi:hypothetical protein